MISKVCKSKTLHDLIETIQKGYSIILYNTGDRTIFEKLCALIKSKALNIEIWISATSIDKITSPFVKCVSKSDFDEIMEIYYLYEFTDKISVISDNPIYPGMMNYVHQGIITKQELVEALVYKL